MTKKKETLGEALNGDHLVEAPYKLDFLVARESEVVCKKNLSNEEVALFRNAVDKEYHFQMYYDGLPLWSFIGRKEGGTDPSEYKYYLYMQICFEILYNKDQVIEIIVHSNPYPVLDITEVKQVEVEFFYSVEWKETTTPFEKRMEKFYQSSIPTQNLDIHILPIINSCMTVLLLTGFLAKNLMCLFKNNLSK